MDIIVSMRSYITEIAEKYTLPKVCSVVFPLIMSGSFVRDCHFMAMQLDDGSTGLSYINISAQQCSDYRKRRESSWRGVSPLDLVDGFGSSDAVANMIAMAAVNAISGHVMGHHGISFSGTSDPFAGLQIGESDTLGMVGFFRPVVAEVERMGARLVVIEKNRDLQLQNRQYDITTDTERLRQCNKIFITATTVLNQTIDDVLQYCDHTDLVAVVGPTLGFLPDPLFARGVSRVGGRYISDGDALLESLKRGQPWGNSTRKTLFLKEKYTSPLHGTKSTT